MEQQSGNRGVGASVPVIAIVATAVAVMVISVGTFLYRSLSSEEAHRQIVIATGPESGTYHALGTALKQVLENSGAFSSVKILNTDGSVENMRLISEEGGVDFAFVQGDAFPSASARLVTGLYEEVLHILIGKSRAQSIKTIYDLQGKRVALGSAGSGTRELSLRVLDHFGVDVGQDMILSPRKAAAGLSDGSIDAAFMLTAIPSELISDLAQRDEIRFITLGTARESGDESHALELVFPGVRRDTIPRATYVRLPQQVVHSVGVAALLVARKDLDEELVRDITAAVFGHHAGSTGLQGSNLLVARRIREQYDPATVTIPYHPGATAYYRREEPPFFVEYAEALSLGLTLMLGLYSVFIALREWLRRRMKNRVDAYLLEVERLVSDFHMLTHDELITRQTQLEELRRAAFADLVAEKLLADEAFIILQNHLRDELSAIEVRITETTATGEAGQATGPTGN